MPGASAATPSSVDTPVEPNPPIAEIELGNPSQFARQKQPLYFSYYDLGIDAAEAQGLGTKQGEHVVPSQAIDRDGDGMVDGLMVLPDFAPAGKLTVSVVASAGAAYTGPKLTQAEVSHKVGGQWEPRPDNANLQHYVGGTFQNVATLSPPPQHTDHSQFIRYEGPGIESDKVGYRIYLDWRNGFDIFGKKLSEPVLARVGLDGYESYHHMADWGMDILKVGQSLGCGGFGFWDKRKVELVSKVDGWNVEITNQGPLYSSFQITYKNWKIAGKTLDVIADFSMTAGSRLVHTRLRLSEELPKLAIGLVKHPGTELIQGPKDLTGKAYTFVGSWGKQALNEDVLGMAVLFQSGDRVSQETDAANYVSVVKPAGKAFSYYFLAAWGSEPDGIQTQEQFSQYLAHEAERLTLEPRVRLGTALAESTKTFPITAASALDWSKKLADSELERKALLYHYDGWDTNRRRKPEFEYDIVGLQPLAYDELSQVAGNAKYAQVSEKVTGSFVTPQGKLLAYDQANYNIDSVMPGRVLLRLYQQTQQNKYKLAAQQLRQQLQRQPKTSGGAFWHKQRYPWQLWLDGVYMALPFLAEYSMLFEKGSSLDEVVTEFQVTRQQLRNPANGLYFHAWDEKRKQSWADPKTGLSRYHWGRGMGWFAMALVDTLDYIPEADAEHRAPLLELINEVAPALVKVQDPATGTWWQILDMPDEAGNYRESTASAMFAYFFTKAVRQGYLPEAYKAVAEKAYAGLIREFVNVHPDGKISMTNQCLVAGLGFGRDGSYRYYMSEPVVENDPKGNGPFILAGIEMHRLLSR